MSLGIFMAETPLPVTRRNEINSKASWLQPVLWNYLVFFEAQFLRLYSGLWALINKVIAFNELWFVVSFSVKYLIGLHKVSPVKLKNSRTLPNWHNTCRSPWAFSKKCTWTILYGFSSFSFQNGKALQFVCKYAYLKYMKLEKVQFLIFACNGLILWHFFSSLKKQLADLKTA